MAGVDLRICPMPPRQLNVREGTILMEKRNGEKTRPFYRFAQCVTRCILKVLCRLEAKGIENIPRRGGVVIASNHASLLDPPSLGCVIPREVSFFAKKELFGVPFVGWFISYANSIPVDRAGYSAQALKDMIHRLEDGWAVLVFPEGTRTKTGELGEPKSGSGMAAVSAGVPIVPCWIEGSFRARLFRSKVVLHFLPPFDPNEIEAPSKKEHYLLVSKRIMNDIYNLQNSQMAVRNQAKSKER
jgi:1-acyl-sn-glycerol-3-phosphate acyltransferase